MTDIDDLRDESGEIDARRVVGGDSTRLDERRNVTANECGRFRTRARDGETAREISREFGVRHDTVSRHLRGDCHHGGDHALEYDKSEKRWVEADDDPSCSRCEKTLDHKNATYCDECYNHLRQIGVDIKAAGD